jgi:hypothetical protein
MAEYFCNGYHCEKCGTLVGVMHREVSTMAELTNVHGQVGAVKECLHCGQSRWLTYEEILALPVKWIQQE